MHCSLAHFGHLSAGSLDPAQDRSCRHSGSSRRVYYTIFGDVILGITLDDRRGARVDDRGVSKTVVVLAGHRVPCGVGRDESALSAKKIIR